MSGSNSNEISPSQTPVSSSNAPKFGTLVPNRIFVGGIHTDTTETELYDLFSAYGNVMATKIIADRAGVSKGYGFVTFETEEEARRIQNEENIILKERKLNVAPAIKKQQPFPRSFGTDISSPEMCSSVEPSEIPLTRGVVGSATEWAAIANQNPAEPAPVNNSTVYYSTGVPYAYPGIYNYVPTEHNPCQFQQPYVLYSPVYIPQPYQTPTTPQVHWGGATFRWPSQVGYEQSNPSPQTSATSTTTSPSVQYAYSLSSGPSTPTSTVSSGQRSKSGTSANSGPPQSVGEKTGTYYPALPASAQLTAPAYAYQMPIQYTIAPQQRIGDGCEAVVGDVAPTESPPFNQVMYQKGPRRHLPNYSPRKGPPFFASQNYNARHYSPQRKPRYYDVNAPSQHYSNGRSSSGNHVVPLTPPATPMTVKGATNGSDHIVDASHRFKSLKLRD